VCRVSPCPIFYSSLSCIRHTNAHFVSAPELERRTEAQNQTTASSQRYASTAEQDSLRALASKHGNDIKAMAKDLKLNKDQRTAGQLSKAFKRCGGVESFLR
jgi:nucleolar protein 16